MEGERILSGGTSCPIARADEAYVAGHADDGSVWVLLLEPALRPRGRAPDVVVSSEAEVSYEPNGLVRVLDRRSDWNRIERLVDELINRRRAVPVGDAAADVLRAGDYDGVSVFEKDGRFLVRTDPRERFARRLQRCGALRLSGNLWQVEASEAGRLRREIVAHLTTRRHRLRLWIALHAREIASLVVLALALVALLEPRVAWLLPPALVVLAVAVVARPRLVERARARWLEPQLALTAPDATGARERPLGPQ